MNEGWIGTDLDGTLAEYPSGDSPNIGRPIPLMLERVKVWLTYGIKVRIVTARAGDPSQIPLIEQWLMHHLGVVIPITDKKDYDMIELWDDRAIQVIPNTGQRADGKL